MPLWRDLSRAVHWPAVATWEHEITPEGQVSYRGGGQAWWGCLTDVEMGSDSHVECVIAGEWMDTPATRQIQRSRVTRLMSWVLVVSSREKGMGASSRSVFAPQEIQRKEARREG
jgi:hypothetical protein